MRSTRSTEAKREHWLKGAAIAAFASLLLLNVGQALAQTANSKNVWQARKKVADRRIFTNRHRKIFQGNFAVTTGEGIGFDVC